MITYILKSIALYHIAQREGVSWYGLAWVPCLRGWIMGSIADKHDLYHGKPDRKFRIFCLIISILNILTVIVLGAVFSEVIARLSRINPSSFESAYYNLSMMEMQFFAVLGSLGIIAFLLLAAAVIMAAASGAVEWVCRYKLFDLCRPSSVLSDLVISAIFPGLGYAIVLMLNKNYRNDYDENAFPMNQV